MLPTPGVIIHADDFGLHPSINEGIERAHRYGLVSSTAIAPIGDAIDDAVCRSRNLPSLDIGLHFALTGIPGRMPTPRRFIADFFLGEMSLRDVAGALRLQLDNALIVHRLSLSHIDSHQNIHVFPPIMRIVCAIAREYDIPAVRLPGDRVKGGPARRRVRSATIRTLTNLSRRYLRAYGLATTDHYVAAAGNLSPQRLSAYLRHAEKGITEIVCHPGCDNRVLKEVFGPEHDWEKELVAVCDEAPRSYFKTGQVQLVTWRNV